jgi:2-keto-4-pentenoate hydratase/2-oxohepta-3-ene-1,7-dioic acid hydratase in catechol pathway
MKEDTFFPYRLNGQSVHDLSDVIRNLPTLQTDDVGFKLSDCYVLAPVGPLRKNVFCVGKNYVDHSHEFAKSGFDNTTKLDLPSQPIIFTKSPTTITGPWQNVKADSDPTGSIDYEGELGVVMGRQCKGAAAEHALDYVFGYTIINDLTSRELQKTHSQWFIGKNLDGFCPIGPWVVTADEVGPLEELQLQTHVNGELRQSASVKDLIFDVPTIIATLSAYMTLEPGDVIATGTPVGVGIGFDPPRFIKAGDTVTVKIDKLGELVTTLV